MNNYRSIRDLQRLSLLIVPLFLTVGPVAAQDFAPKLYWGDVAAQTIKRANLDGSGPEDLVSANITEIAFDHAAAKMYWADRSGASIRRGNLDGSLPETIITPSLPPVSIAFDPVERKIYFSLVASQIWRADFDGTNAELVLADGRFHRGLAIDAAERKLYWVDLASAGAGGSTINRSNLDGSELEIILSGIPPLDLALDSTDGKMYWTQQGGAVRRANLDGSMIEDLANLPLVTPNSIAVDIEGRKLYFASAGPCCGGHVIYRTNLDGLDFEEVVTDIGFPTGVAILPRNTGRFIISTNIPDAKLDDPFSVSLSALGGVSPITWSWFAGELPTGLSISGDGVITGIPTEPRVFNFTVRAVDAEGSIADRDYEQSIVLIDPPSLKLQKFGTILVPGRQADYFVLVENQGTSELGPLRLFETPLPESTFTIQSASPPATVLAEDAVVWDIESLRPNEQRILSYSGTVSSLLGLEETLIGQAIGECPECKASPQCISRDSLCMANSGFCPAATRECAAVCRDICPENWSAEDRQLTIGAKDPNEKLVLANEFIQPTQTLVYPIYFENIGDIEARDVFVTDVLASELDITSIEFLDANPGQIDFVNRTIKWELLNRNLEPGETDNVLFSIRPKAGIASGTEIRNSAEIQFEVFDSLVTPEVVNVIDSTPPVCTLNTLPPITETLEFPISWTGMDGVGQVDKFSVLVSADGGAFAALLSNTTYEETSFVGEEGRTYEFLCIATDTAGNIETQGLIAETETTIVFPEPPDDDLTFEEIHEFFVQSVANGTIKGNGRGIVGFVRLLLFHSTLGLAQRKLENERVGEACLLLAIALSRSDGLRRPTDWLRGAAVVELHAMLSAFRDKECATEASSI